MGEAINHSSPFKGLFLEKAGAASPEDFYALVKGIECKRPGLVVELGYKMHYSEVLDFARKVVKEGVFRDIATARFYGGCPSRAGIDLWQAIPEDLGVIMQTEGCHMLENVVGLFGVPDRMVSTIRKLPEKLLHLVLGWISDLFSGTATTGEFGVGTLMYEDIASGMIEYTDKTITLDMTAWEATEWYNEWAIDIYGRMDHYTRYHTARWLHFIFVKHEGVFQRGLLTWLRSCRMGHQTFLLVIASSLSPCSRG